jgi:hypothetical protein
LYSTSSHGIGFFFARFAALRPTLMTFQEKAKALKRGGTEEAEENSFAADLRG